MKIKRIILMLALVLAIAAIPLLGDITQDGSYERGGYAIFTFDVYGYGTLRATIGNNQAITNGARLPVGTAVTIHATEIGDAHKLTGWRVNGMPYRGTPSLTHRLSIAENTHVRAVFDHPWAAEGTPASDTYVLIPQINVIGLVDGTVAIQINGVSNVNYTYSATRQTIEFTITPPAGRYFSTETTLSMSTDISRTNGPTVRNNGSLSFTILAPVVDMEDTDPTPSPAPTATPGPAADPTASPTPSPDPTSTPVPNHVIGFNASPGYLADDESGIRLIAHGDYFEAHDLPTAPTRSGHRFVGWRLPNGNTFDRYVRVTSDLMLTAVWAQDQPAATATPSPTTAPTATPGPSSSSSTATATPGPSSSSSTSATPGPSSSSSTRPSATPGPSSSGAARPNPQTNDTMQISLMIFGVVLIGGLAAFGIITLNRKQMAASDKYRSDNARYNREKRLMDFIDKD